MRTGLASSLASSLPLHSHMFSLESAKKEVQPVKNVFIYLGAIALAPVILPVLALYFLLKN